MNTKKKKTTERATKILRPPRVGKVTRRQAVKAVKAVLKEEAAAKEVVTKKKAMGTVSKLTIRVPESLKKRLKRLSKKTNVPMGHYVQEGIKTILSKYEKKGQ